MRSLLISFSISFCSSMFLHPAKAAEEASQKLKDGSFLTGPPDKIAELAQRCGASDQFHNGTFNHNFRTLIVDTAGNLQMVFPKSGNLSEAIVDQVVKAAAVTNPPRSQNQNQ